MPLDLSYLSIPLPEEVVRIKQYGDFQGAAKVIDHLLERKIPFALKKRLEIEKEIIKMIGINEYPFSVNEAIHQMREAFEQFESKELDQLMEESLVDWIYVGGEPHFQRRFLLNLVKTQPAYAERLIKKEDSETDQLRKIELTENIRLMKENGHRKVKIHIRSSIKIKKEHERIGEQVKVHLPVPRNAQQISEIKILKHSEADKVTTSPEDSYQRTICFETRLKENEEFFVEYEYVNEVHYIELDALKAEKAKEEMSDLEEQLPHIRFTPYLQSILDEVLDGETNTVIQARKIYDFITTNVKYSFMREYFTIDNISEYAAVNLKGDCGVQAILFITLCRMAGIPAKWQSGLYVSQYYTGCHDWAQFYVEPYGWIFADLSFGGGAYAAGDIERWNYYFGNLDIFRMPANDRIQEEFIPAKLHVRADPIDNQRGEWEYGDQGIPYAYLEVKQELISMKEIWGEGEQKELFRKSQLDDSAEKVL
ncbi:transglutaminase domain-containing protein [Enterococcus sp. BWT-B8]|uniref:transglutaminase-like domain-containing protein n=1 Tax=Enterococcus sp. BWT-B8 TaxID=2885157 RepID=UPI001E3234E4|nr:transglutaminase domain-containing protein [Enterococcus sp. BWT-B8]MCB5950742.1 transglutaminase domain-containing protein [Enterococcus sp. BWT-B8]